MDRNKYEYIQSRFSAKLKKYPNNREAAYNDGILACKSILKEIYERERQIAEACKECPCNDYKGD